MQRSSGSSSGRLWRSSSVGANEAALCRVELWARHVAEHTELVARAMDLDRVTADAINEAQALSAASRVARWERHGLGPPPDGCGTTSNSWYSRRIPPMSPSRFPTVALESPPGTWRADAPYSRLSSSAMDISQSSLGVSLVPDTSRLSSSRAPETRRVVLAPAPSAWTAPSRTNEWPLSPEPIRPAIYSASTPRRRHRTDLQSYLPTSPFRPVLPSRSEAGYALESPRQHSPYRQQSPRGSSMHRSTLRGGGISEIRAKRDRLALEVSHSFDSPRHSPSRAPSPRGGSNLGPTLLRSSMAEINARRDRLAREVAKINSNSVATTWRSPWVRDH